MSASPKPKLTPTEYLAIERLANYKSELYQGEMFAMAGASRAHNRIKDNLIIGIGSQLKGGPCQTFSTDQRVAVETTGLVTYPDVVILCGEAEDSPLDADTLLNPTALIEVLSTTTERFDRGAKFRNYQQISSLQEYVLVSQEEPVCERFVRLADGSWAIVSFVGLDATLEFTKGPARVPLNDVYSGVVFPDAPQQ